MKYRIEVRDNKHSEDWKAITEYLDWDSVYKLYRPEYERKSREQFEGFVNIHIATQKGYIVDNALLFDGWLKIAREKQNKRDVIIASINKIWQLSTNIEIRLSLETILENLEPIRGEEDYWKTNKS